MEDTTIENVLKTFEDLYLKKDFPNALLILQKNQSEIPAGLWHYNMGTVYGEMQNFALARFHFLMAESHGMNGKAVKQNQRLVEEKLEIDRLEQPLDKSDYLIKGGLLVSEGPLTTMALLLLVAGLWMLKKAPTWKTILGCLLMAGTPFALNLWIDSWPKKIVISNKAIYEGPSAIFGVSGELPPGVMVLTNTKGEWEKIIYPSRFNGWIKSEGLKRLE